MSIIKSLGLSLILVFSTFIGSQGQDFKNKPTKKYTIPKDAKIVPGVVLLKLKPEYRLYTNNLEALKRNKAVAEHLNKYNVKKFEKLTPQATAPAANAKNKQGKPLVDLSLIHAIHFNTDQSVEDMINLLMSTGFVEYAEPQFEDQMLYIPSDTLAAPGKAQELLFNRINAYKAWDVEQGDTNVVIGVLDTGTEPAHPDLAPNIKYNWADPIGGGDNDNDGFTDNFRGWDVGSNDNNPTWQVADHGVRVHGACSAMPNNISGTAGTGFYCKSLPIKISNSGGALTAGYTGIYYAAEHGVKVMNLSWGGYGGYSQTNQAYIDYAAINKDVLIVASAGNTEGELDFYPASYNNVISVAGLDTITSPLYDTLCEIRKTFNFGGFGMSYSFNVDLASLEGGFSTGPSNTWQGFGGSSFAAPTVAGAAALVRSKFPNLSAIQAGELLRVTGDILDTFDITRPESRYKTGRKLNMYKAVTDSTTPSVRMTSFKATSRFGTDMFSGDTVTITNDFFNYLSGTNSLTIKMICLNGFVEFLDSICYLGNIDSLTGKNNLSDPFRLIIKNNAGPSEEIDLVMLMTDPTKNYYDFQGFKIIVNPSYLKMDTSKVKTTITSNGRVGYNVYETSSPTQGLGVTYLNNALLYEGGFMVGTTNMQVSDCIRGNFGTVDNEFKSIRSVHYIHSPIKDMEAYTIFNDSLSANIIGVEVVQRSYAWKNIPNDKFVIMEYQLINKSTFTYDSIAAGLFADWDIANYQYNRADWDDDRKVAYTYSTEGGTKVAGISVLTDNPPSCYSLDNSGVGGTNINPNDGFTSSEKFNTLHKGIFRKQAGTSGFGNDVSQVTGAKIYDFAPGDTETVAFAIIGADNVFELLEIAEKAKEKFVSIKQGPVPTAPNVNICRGDTIDITFTPTNGNKFAFFSTPPPAAPDYVGTSYTLTNVSQSDTIFICNADSLFYSDKKTVYINKDNMQLAFYPSTDTIVISSNSSLLLVNQSNGASSTSWDMGDGTILSGSSVNHTYTTEGYYDIKLSGISPLSCQDTLSRVLRVEPATGTSAILNGTSLNLYPNPVSDQLTLSFSNGDIPADLSVELINSVGTSVYYASEGTKNTTINMSEFPSGIYFIKLKSGKDSLNKKIVKN